jgi:hypothetical protein
MLAFLWAVDAGAVPCRTPPLAPVSFAWPANQTIKVNISPAFPSDQEAAIRAAFNAWARADTDSGLSFEFSNLAAEQAGAWGGAKNTLQVNKKVPGCVGVGGQCLAEVGEGGDLGTRRRSGYVNISPSITDPLALQNAMAHEIGHTYGLDDCIWCAPGSSVMNGTSGPTDTKTGLPGPSPCDERMSRVVFGNHGEPPRPGDGGGGEAGRCRFCSRHVCGYDHDHWVCKDVDGVCCDLGFIPLDEYDSTPTCGFLNFWGPEQLDTCQSLCNDDCRKKQECGDLPCMPTGYCWKCPDGNEDSGGDDPGPPGKSCDEMGWFNADKLSDCEAACGGSCGKKQWCDNGVCQPWPFYCWKCSN